MDRWDALTWRGWRAYALLVVPLAAVAALVGSATATLALGDGSVLSGLAQATASVLLVGVAAGVAHAALEWRQAIRHDSIRADIAAAGGLGKRLMV